MKQKIRPQEFGKNSKDPFEGDLLNRKEEIEDLTPMIKTIASPAVMALDAPWGAGKTAFIKMWAAHLRHNEGILSPYFNAWQTDLAADPLVPFMEKITEQLPGKDGAKLLEGVQDILPLIAGDVVSKYAGNALGGAAKKSMEKLFTHHSKMKKFRDELERIATSKEAGRMVIFVDELDRCRPDYAVKVLERIKHLFEVPGLIFVLAVNRKQLRDSVNALYGTQENDADIYLRRFIEFDFSIKKPDMVKFIRARLESLGINKFLHGRNIISDFQADQEKLLETLGLLTKLYGSSLRDAEHLLMRVVLVLYSLEDSEKRKYHFHPTLLAFLVLARQEMAFAYGKYILPENNGEDIIAEWERKLKEMRIFDESQIIIADREASFVAAYTTAHLILAKCYNNAPPPQSLVKRYQERAESAPTPEAKRYYGEVARLSESLPQYSHWGIRLSYLVKKIELLDKFRFSHTDGNKGNDGEEDS